MTRLNLNFPEDLHKRFKAACALQGVKMTDTLIAMVREFVERFEKKQKK